MLSQELPFLTLTEQASLVRGQKISPTDLVEAYLNRIGTLDGKLHAYITVCADEALRAARQAQQDIASGKYKGTLHGIPISVKDNFWTEGVSQNHRRFHCFQGPSA